MNFFHIFVRQRSLLALPAFVAVSLFLFSVSGAISAQELKLDPKKVTGPDACGECHKNTITAWKSSKHSTTFKKLPRSKDGKKIAKAMGLRRIKAASDCLSCHFTSGVSKGKVKPIA
ncbi:MAG: multiheme c-type cytochrome, partial [Rhodospirillales bacterium]